MAVSWNTRDVFVGDRNVIIFIQDSRILFVFKIIITVFYSNQKKLCLSHNISVFKDIFKASSRRLARGEIVRLGGQKIVTLKTASGHL